MSDVVSHGSLNDQFKITQAWNLEGLPKRSRGISITALCFTSLDYILRSDLITGGTTPPFYFFAFTTMTIAKTKQGTYALMEEIIDEVLQDYRSAQSSDSVNDVVNEGFQKALDELHKISF